MTSPPPSPPLIQDANLARAVEADCTGVKAIEGAKKKLHATGRYGTPRRRPLGTAGVSRRGSLERTVPAQTTVPARSPAHRVRTQRPRPPPCLHHWKTSIGLSIVRHRLEMVVAATPHCASRWSLLSAPGTPGALALAADHLRRDWFAWPQSLNWARLSVCWVG